MLEELTGSSIRAPDPMAATLDRRQPNPRFDAFAEGWIDDLARSSEPETALLGGWG